MIPEEADAEGGGDPKVKELVAVALELPNENVPPVVADVWKNVDPEDAGAVEAMDRVGAVAPALVGLSLSHLEHLLRSFWLQVEQ